jgi:hypothetical protein
MRKQIYINMIRLRDLLTESNAGSHQLPNLAYWENIWHLLRKQSVSFNTPDHNTFAFGGLFFFLDEDEGVLELPPQKLSDWRDVPDQARTVLNNYVKRIQSALVELDDDVRLEVDADYSMKIRKA